MIDFRIHYSPSTLFPSSRLVLLCAVLLPLASFVLLRPSLLLFGRWEGECCPRGDLGDPQQDFPGELLGGP